MNYRACYHCELLFEADETARCPQCDRMLAPYVPDDGGSGGSVKALERAGLAGEAVDADPRDGMVPVSRSEWPHQIDGGRRSGYGRRQEEQQRRGPDYDPRAPRAYDDPIQPANRALPGQADPDAPRRRNTGSIRLGRSESPGRRSSGVNTDRARRNTREVDLRGPSSPKAPRQARSVAESPRGDVARRDERAYGPRSRAPSNQPQASNAPQSIPRRAPIARSEPPRAAPAARGAPSIGGMQPTGAIAPPAPEMESTRMLSAIDLAQGAAGIPPDPGTLDRTRMVSPILEETITPDEPAGDGMERTRMLSAIDLAQGGGMPGGAPGHGGAAELDRTRMVGTIDDEVTRFRPSPGRAAPPPSPMDDERTRLHSPIPDPSAFPSPQPAGPSPFPSPQPAGANPFPSPQPAGPSPFPSPQPAGPSPFPSPQPAGPSPFPSPQPAAPPPSDLRRASPTPLAPPPGAAPATDLRQAAPAPVAPPPGAAPATDLRQARPAPVAPPPGAGTSNRRRTQADIAQPAAPVAQPAAPVAPPAAPVAPPAAPDYRDQYASYFDARGAAGQQPDMLGDLIGEEQAAPAPPPRRGRRRRGMNPLIWIVPIVLFVAVLVVVAIFAGGGDDEEIVDAGVAEPTEAGVEQVVTELGLQLPRIRGAEELTPGPFIVAGPDALRVRGVPRVMGISSARIPDHLVIEGDDGEWIKALRDALGKTPQNQRALLALALDDGVDARAVARFAHSAERAGFERIGLVVRRIEAGGGLGYIPFNTGLDDIPSAGAASIRVGRLAVIARIERRDEEPEAETDARIATGDDGRLDLDAIDGRLDRLAKRNPLVRLAMVHAYPELILRDLAALMERARSGPDKERFTRLQLIVK